jgi:hypothetical protein
LPTKGEQEVTKTTTKIVHEDRAYEVDVIKFDDGGHHAMYETHHVYRLKKDGKRGLKLAAHHAQAWAIISKL